MNNFKTLFNIGEADVNQIIAEIHEHQTLWNQYPIRTTIKKGVFNDCSDILLQYQDIGQAKDGLFDHLETISYPGMHILPRSKMFVFALMSMLKAERLGRAMITALPSQGRITAHKDSKIFCDYYNRYHLCLKNNKDAIFRCGNEYFVPNVGDVFWFDNSLEHEVWNGGTTDRWTMIVDLKIPRMFNGVYTPIETELTEDANGNYVAVEKPKVTPTPIVMTKYEQRKEEEVYRYDNSAVDIAMDLLFNNN